MRKILTSLSSALFLIILSVNANAGGSIGISGMVMEIDGSGSETVDNSNKNTGGTSSESVSVGSIFFETEKTNGWVLGMDLIPGSAEFVSSSKTQTNVTTAAGATESKTQKVSGDIENHFTIYLEKDIYEGVYLKLGGQSVDIISTENIGTGSQYPDTTIYGYTVGAGYRYDLDNMFIKLEYTYQDYDSIKLSATNTTNFVEGDIDAHTGKIAIGYKF